MDNFKEYLKGSELIFYADPTPTLDLGTTQTKTWNRLQTAMSEHNFYTKNWQQANLPTNLKNGQNVQGYVNPEDKLKFMDLITAPAISPVWNTKWRHKNLVMRNSNC